MEKELKDILLTVVDAFKSEETVLGDFKLGDKVKVMGRSEGQNDVKIGDEGTIIAFSISKGIMVEFEEIIYVFKLSDIALVDEKPVIELKIGDLVEVINNDLCQNTVEIGTKTRIKSIDCEAKQIKDRRYYLENNCYLWAHRQLRKIDEKPVNTLCDILPDIIVCNNEPNITLQDLVCKMRGYVRIKNANTNKIYYGGKVEHLPCKDLFSKASNMWVYGKVVEVLPRIFSVKGTRKMGIEICVDMKGIVESPYYEELLTTF